jgi:hypothetical protein
LVTAAAFTPEVLMELPDAVRTSSTLGSPSATTAASVGNGYHVVRSVPRPPCVRMDREWCLWGPGAEDPEAAPELPPLVAWVVGTKAEEDACNPPTNPRSRIHTHTG